MGKKSRRKAKRAQAPSLYVPPLNPRPFAGLANEVEFAAMRDLLPAASLTLRTTPDFGEREITFVTVAPGQAQGVVRTDGVIMVALQTRSRTADASHDLGLVSAHLCDCPPGTVLSGFDLRRHGPKLHEVVASEAGKLEVHSDLGFWLTDDERTDDAREVIRRSGEELVACAPIPGQRATFWTSMNADFLRMVLPQDEETVFDGLARLRADGQLDIAEGPAQARFIGAFRLYGLVAPVWEFSEGVTAEVVAEEVAALRERIDVAVASSEPLSAPARRAREGIISRGVSVR